MIKTTGQFQCSITHRANAQINLVSHEVYKCAEVNQYRKFLSSLLTPSGKEDPEQAIWLFLLHCFCNWDLELSVGNQGAEIPEFLWYHWSLSLGSHSAEGFPVWRREEFSPPPHPNLKWATGVSYEAFCLCAFFLNLTFFYKVDSLKTILSIPWQHSWFLALVKHSTVNFSVWTQQLSFNLKLCAM